MLTAINWAKGLSIWAEGENIKFKSAKHIGIKELKVISISNIKDTDFPGWGSDNFSVLDIVVDADFDTVQELVFNIPGQATHDLLHKVAVDLFMLRSAKGDPSSSIYKVNAKQFPIVDLIPVTEKAVLSLNGFNSKSDAVGYQELLQERIQKAILEGRAPKAVRDIMAKQEQEVVEKEKANQAALAEHEYDGLRQQVEAAQAEDEKAEANAKAAVFDSQGIRQNVDVLQENKVDERVDKTWDGLRQKMEKETKKKEEKEPVTEDFGVRANEYALKGLEEAKAGKYKEAANLLNKAESTVAKMFSDEKYLKNYPDKAIEARRHVGWVISMGRDIIKAATGHDGSPQADRDVTNIDPLEIEAALNRGKEAYTKSQKGFEIAQNLKAKPTVYDAARVVKFLNEANEGIVAFQNMDGFFALKKKDPVKIKSILTKVQSNIDKGRKLLEASGLAEAIDATATSKKLDMNSKNIEGHALDLGLLAYDKAKEANAMAQKNKTEKRVNFDIPNKALDDAEKLLQDFQSHDDFEKLKAKMPAKVYDIVGRTTKLIEDGRKKTGAITAETVKQTKLATKEADSKVDTLQGAVEVELRGTGMIQQAAPYLLGLYLKDSIPHRFIKISGHNDGKIAKSTAEDGLSKGKPGYDIRFICIVEHDGKGKFKLSSWVPKARRG